MAALKSLFWPLPGFQDLCTHHDWSVKNSIVDLPIRLKGNLGIRLRVERQDLKAQDLESLSSIASFLNKNLPQQSFYNCSPSTSISSFSCNLLSSRHDRVNCSLRIGLTILFYFLTEALQYCKHVILHKRCISSLCH